MQTGPRLDGKEPITTIFKRTWDEFSGPFMGLKTALTNYQGKWPRVKKKNHESENVHSGHKPVLHTLSHRNYSLMYDI